MRRSRSDLVFAIVTLSATVGCRGEGEGEAEISDEGGCQDPEPEFVSLVDHSAWQFTPAEEDPLVDHRPDVVDCGIAGWYPQLEGSELEIDTNFCNYASLRQDALAAIEVCTPIKVGIYHFDLLAPEPAQAHAALLIDGTIVWEKFIDIPGKAAVYEEEFPSPIAAPVGAEVMLHLHNHGQNTWTVLTIEAGH
ncbi:hypothetical protein ACNOYE_15740 [Nannocystaceae bacterium ST9]